MATLTRPRSLSAQARNHTHSLIDSHVPSPFPTQILQREREREQQEEVPAVVPEEIANEDPFVDQNEESGVNISVSVESVESEAAHSRNGSHEQDGESAETELVPTLSYVQQSCLMALNSLLSGLFISTPHWKPILPPRRHSMPSRPEDASANGPSSALRTLLENLRNSDQRTMSEASSSSADDTVLLGELQRRVEAMSHELLPLDAQLARALISLLAHVNKLASIDPNLSSVRAANVTSLESLTARSQVDIYDQLSRQLLDLQHQRLDRTFDGVTQDSSSSPQRKVEVALLWSRIDQELETVSGLCRQRNEPPPSPYPDVLPPEYDPYGRGDDDALLPPEYDYASSAHAEKEKAPTYTHHQTQASDVQNEKMRMDLDAVTMAIDRLYLVAPQLHNQRVELRKSKVDELERARLAGPSSSTSSSARHAERSSRGKGKGRELERIIDLVGKASSRRMDDQSVELNPDMKTRLERSKQMDKAKRDAFVERLLSHSNSRRIDSQDASFQSEQVKSDETLLTLPEFIRERVPDEMQQELERDPDALLTLSEIVKEPPPPPQKSLPKSAPSIENLRTHFRSFTKRNRSLSAPPLAWLIPSLSRSSSSSRLAQMASESSMHMRKVIVRYVAEHHENLNHVFVFVGVDEGLTAGCDLEAEVIPSVGDPSLGDKLVLKSGSRSSAPLGLPLLVPAGRVTVQVQGAHYEIKIPLGDPASGSGLGSRPSSSSISRHTGILPSPNRREAFENGNGNGHGYEQMHSQLLDATQVSEMDPTSFICASCSSALVQSPHSQSASSQTQSASSQTQTQNQHQNQNPQNQHLNQSSEKLTYLDLPSEHWEELLEAWMCHTDQKLSERVARHGRGGFYPRAGQVFVGGSYFLFHESAVVYSNLRVVDASKGEEWKRVQCICGAVIGRCRTHSEDRNRSGPEGEGEGSVSTVYRIPKYALRPVSLTSEPIRVPLSAFILEDMMEFVRAHATYRFVILDEEEERPRLLIWLFKPHMRLSYATTAQYALPRTGSVHASKVLFKILQSGGGGSSEGPNGSLTSGGSLTPTPSPTHSSTSNSTPAHMPPPCHSSPASHSHSPHSPHSPHTSIPLRTPPSSPHSPSSFNLENILARYPGFPQAERLLYPRDVCQRLAALLKESNTAYPFGVRVMTGLLTGWLQRA